MKEAWARTNDRWFNYLLTMLEYVFVPVLLVSLISILAVFLVPSILGSMKDPNSNAAVQMVYAALAIIIPVAAIIGTIYRYIVGTIALLKTVIDEEKNRKKSISEAKALVFPYLRFISVLTLLNIGFVPFVPLSLFILLVYIQIWTTFAMFSFVSDQKKGLYNLWKALAVLRTNFWAITTRAILLQLFVILVGSAGSIIATVFRGNKNPDAATAIMLLQLLIALSSFFTQIFATAYMYELYRHAKVPTKVKASKPFIVFSLLGWIILLVLTGFGINYFVTMLSSALVLPQR